ncbi:uncharacterized protein BYT42DRAFT_173676 [Radiomyces spectabilis]|uniref:uncharacterized protein n=1 Tax=Radiomyces spectabilis TaxID=64574 RepID=UPI00221E51D8|nr:uncharacterized protein BYT42DRAFT_173676 [Radiomyces spectabilis]KAI8390896.1 hypothetical protein BYT42DRAFT_173676 [Radiomyces spectabilis]
MDSLLTHCLAEIACTSTHYEQLLDIITHEFESILQNACIQSKGSNRKMNQYAHRFSTIVKQARKFIHESFPSPPLSCKDDPYPDTYQWDLPSYSGDVPDLRWFIDHVAKSSLLDIGTLLSTVIYARRLKHILSEPYKTMPSTNQRLFLAILIVLSKYIHDIPLKNALWMVHAEIFSIQEINAMEWQLLELLGFNLTISVAEFDSVLSIYRSACPLDFYTFPSLRTNSDAFSWKPSSSTSSSTGSSSADRSGQAPSLTSPTLGSSIWSESSAEDAHYLISSSPPYGETASSKKNVSRDDQTYSSAADHRHVTFPQPLNTREEPYYDVPHWSVILPELFLPPSPLL